MPVSASVWDLHVEALVESLRAVSSSMTRPAQDEFETLRVWVDDLVNAGRRTASCLLALEPFAPFDNAQANSLLEILNDLANSAAKALDEGQPYTGPDQPIDAAAEWWSARHPTQAQSELWVAAFNMNTPPLDERGEFRPDWVLQNFAYKNGELLQLVLPHLRSLGIPVVPDPLVGVIIVGGILNCEDPVLAYISMKMLVDRYLAADDRTAAAVHAHLESSEAAMKRTSEAVARAMTTAAAQGESLETRAAAMADAYRRIVEGPFRQFSWATYCLGRGEWISPPTLSELRDRIIAAGGPLGAIVNGIVLTDMRNAEAHESWAWDGFADEFVTEGGRLPFAQVGMALLMADTYSKGNEAGFAVLRALGLPDNSLLLPVPGEPGRMPSWRRVHAFFGTNRLRLLDSQLNTRNAVLRVERLAATDINPCFQALVLARRLIPEIANYSVTTPTSNGPLIVLSSDALDAVMPIWELAIASVDRMPLCTFLPANLDARSKHETRSIAIRSAAWIAVDDAVGAIDGSPAVWSHETLELVRLRYRIVELAVQETLRFAGADQRLESVLGSVQDLRDWLAADLTRSQETADMQPALIRLRTQWEQWGPVLRQPLIPEDYLPDRSDIQPALREPPDDGRFITL